MKNTGGPESIIITHKTPICPDSWWTTPGTRDEFYQRWQQRLPAMKKTRQAGYGRADGIDAQ